MPNPAKTSLSMFASVALLAMSPSAEASFTTFKNDKAGWIDAVGGSFTTLDFNFGEPVILSDQYASLGVIFPEPDDNTWKNPGGFPNDGWGAKGGLGNPGSITLQFLTHQNWIAAEYPGQLRIDLYSENKLIYSGEGPFQPTLGLKFFGVAGKTSFDKAVITDLLDGFVNIDDLHFGAPIPARGVLGVMGMAGLLLKRRRRPLEAAVPMIAAAGVFFAAPTAEAGIIYSSTSKDDWTAAVGAPVTTIGFIGMTGQFITEQYADLGVHFTDGDDYGTFNGNFLDLFGIKGAPTDGGHITLQFDTPQTWIAVNFLGVVKFELYSGPTLLGTTGNGGGGQPGNHFFGILADTSFDKVIISDPADGSVFIDDLHFFSPIPGPGLLAVVVVMAGVFPLRGRRRSPEIDQG